MSDTQGTYVEVPEPRKFLFGDWEDFIVLIGEGDLARICVKMTPRGTKRVQGPYYRELGTDETVAFLSELKKILIELKKSADANERHDYDELDFEGWD